MIIKTSKLTDAVRRVSRIASPRFKFDTDSAVNAFSKTLIFLEFFAEEKGIEIKCIGDAQVFSEWVDASPAIGEEGFKVAVYPNTLLDVIRSGDSMIELNGTSAGLVARLGDKLTHKIKNQERVLEYFDDFTAKPVESGGGIRVNAIDFHDALSYCLHAAGDRFDFITIRAVEDSIWMAGTDGFRAAFVNDIAERIEEDININIGTSEARTLLSVIPNDEVDVVLLVKKNKIYLSFDSFSSSTLLTNTAIDVFDVLRGKEKPSHAVFKADLDVFTKAIRFLSVMSADGGGKTSLSVGKGSVKMRAVANQIGDTTWIMPAVDDNLPEEGLDVNFNPSFVGKYLSVVKPSELSVCLSDNPNHPVFLESENKNQIFLFMPMH